MFNIKAQKHCSIFWHQIWTYVNYVLHGHNIPFFFSVIDKFEYNSSLILFWLFCICHYTFWGLQVLTDLKRTLDWTLHDVKCSDTKPGQIVINRDLHVMDIIQIFDVKLTPWTSLFYEMLQNITALCLMPCTYFHPESCIGGKSECGVVTTFIDIFY